MSKKSEIVASLRKGLESGAFPANEPLPSEHALMRRHGVARGTVRAAIGELEKAGLVDVRGRSGVYPVVKKIVTFAVLFPDTTSPLASAVCTGLSRRAKCNGGGLPTRSCGALRPFRAVWRALRTSPSPNRSRAFSSFRLRGGPTARRS